MTKRQKENEESTEILWGRHKGRQGEEDQKKQGKVNINCMFILTWVTSSLFFSGGNRGVEKWGDLCTVTEVWGQHLNLGLIV